MGEPSDNTRGPRVRGASYKWVALSNTTLGMLAATVNASIVIIALPAIFRGIDLNPLEPSNISYLLWMLMGYLVVSAVLVVTLGRLGDIYGRVRMYNAGFAIFGLGALALPFDPFKGPSGALWLIGFRVIQAVGGAMLMANSPAILTDAFPANQRGTAMGINQVAGISGQFIGLILGGVLAAVDWRLVFIVSVPIGLGGTIWSYLSLKEVGVRTPAKIDWLGNVAFAVGLIMLLTGITYGIQPYGGHSMGWTSPLVLTGLIGGPVLLALFCVIETRVEAPMFDLHLMKIRAFAAGTGATLLAAIARGGLQFMLIIWLQGIWLPIHGYAFSDTPLWSGIYLLALTCGFVVSGPVSGWLSDKHGARMFASGGLLVSALAFGGLLLIPVDFSYPEFAALIFLAGAGMGLFSAPNAAAIMNSVPARQRGAASGMLATFQNSGFVLSIGVFFSLMIAGLAATLPTTLTNGLTAQGVPHAIAAKIGGLPPVGSLFAAFLGYNPIKELLGPTGVLSHLPAGHVARLTGKAFFPGLISQPFHHGLVIVFSAAICVLVIAAGASALRGGKYVHEEAVAAATIAASTATTGAGTDIISEDIAADEAQAPAEVPAAEAGSAADAGEHPNGAARATVRSADGRATPNA
ncbi:MAG TPA: MFS transporter [Streptosporangiaceae bacterium]|nr:MFS transporter [Streptosporangiaceae bacterium]